MGDKKRKSKKRFDTNSSPEDLVFFVDRSLGRNIIPQALKGAGTHAVAHDDIFEQNTADVEWLSAVGEKRWVVIMGDKRIRKNPLERQTLISARVRAFVLTAGAMKGEDKARLLVRNLKKIIAIARNTNPPFIAAVSTSGVRIYPEQAY